jgi:hypothetical protein
MLTLILVGLMAAIGLFKEIRAKYPNVIRLFYILGLIAIFLRFGFTGLYGAALCFLVLILFTSLKYN